MEDTIPLQSISRLDIQPGETLVVHMHRVLSQQAAHDVRQRILPHLPDGVRLLVLGSDIELATLVCDHGDWPSKDSSAKGSTS